MARRYAFLTMLTVCILAAGLLTVPMVAARPPAQPPETDLAQISEETGLLASNTSLSDGCTFSDEHGVYLCPPKEPTTRPTRDPEAAARAQAALWGGGGLLLVPDSTADRVMAFDPQTGAVIDPNFIPADPAHLDTPINAILSADGNSILVSDQLADAVFEYGLDGTFIITFTVGGALDNIRGIELRPNGNLLVTVGGGANDDAVAEFDTNGTYLGNFIPAGSGGLASPFDVYRRPADFLVSAIDSDNVLRYDLAGAFLNIFAATPTFPEQIQEVTSGGNVLVANFSASTQEGILEFQANGTFVGRYDPAPLTGYRGTYQLGNGNILVTTGTGVHEIDRTSAVVATEIGNASARFIELVVLPSAAPAISVTKTVGTNSSTCATTNAITVTAGTNVVYCYVVENTGTVTLTRHTLMDSELGTILNNFPFTLVPGASAFLTQTTPITQTTVNTATWTAFNPGPTNVVSATDAATVTVTSPTAAISLSKTVGTNSSTCATTNAITVTAGTNVVYCYVVENTGTVTLTRHTLTDSELGTILNNFPFTLVPGASAFLTQTTPITQTTVNTAVWNAFNPGGGASASATDQATVNVVSNPTAVQLGRLGARPGASLLPLTGALSVALAGLALAVGRRARG